MTIMLPCCRAIPTALICFSVASWPVAAAEGGSRGLPPLREVLDSKLDLWGEAAMRQTNGANYEFFEDLLPPPRYVHADFRYYPIVLSAPNAKVKARLISNGSGLNLPGGSRSWHDVGTSVTFRVGPDEFRFGDIRARVSHPTLAEGYLPIPEIRYAHASEVYRLEAFASTEPSLSEFGVVFVKFDLTQGANGIITIDPGAKGLTFAGSRLTNAGGDTLVCFDSNWKWERELAHATITTTRSATAAVVTRPVLAPVRKGEQPMRFLGEGFQVSYDEQRRRCTDTWRNLLSQGMNVETPEPLVNHAWKNLVIQNFTLANNDRLYYSAGNQYEKMYAAETSDAAVPLMWWGYEKEMRRFLPVILNLTDKRLPHHFASHKLNSLCRYYWQTRDAESVKELRPSWQKELDLILSDRKDPNGLLSKENYCTDIEVPVYPLTANATSWAALRDTAAVLAELRDSDQATRVRDAADEFKKHLLEAVDKNQRNVTDPPFIPMALFHTEDTHDPITNSRLGSYWDLVVNYVIGSRLFVNSPREFWLSRYIETHGGLCMGLTRSAATNNTFWTGTHRTNPLYGMRYILDTLRRDDPDRALVSFYGMLAHGMTRNTFIGAEGCSIEPLDDGGRFFYCPPNSASNGQWLAVLRHLLIQDLDVDEDGAPDTLRLLFATPRRWLEDGKTIDIENAPTAFGPISMTAASKLSSGQVLVSLALPERNRPKKCLLRARLPEGWRVVSASAERHSLPIDSKGTADLTKLTGKAQVRFEVRRER
jgi:hypothetical protein